MHRKLAILIVLFVLAAATLPAVAQQPYTPTFGEWVHVWTKANVEQLYRLSEGIYGESKVGSVERLRGMTPAYQITILRADDQIFEQRKHELQRMLKEQIQLWQAAGMDISMDDFHIVQKNAPDSDYRIQNDLQTLNSQTQLYKFKTGGDLPSIEALVKERYLNEAPDAAGGKFVMGEDGVWSHVPGEQPKAEEAPKPATPQQLDRWNKSYTPTLGEWAFIWAKSNFETVLPAFEMELRQRVDEMTHEQYEAMERQIGVVFVVRHPGRVPGIEIRIATITAQDDAPFYVEWMKTQKSLLEAQVKQWQAAGLDISMDDFIITHVSLTSAISDPEMYVQMLDSQTALFKFRNNGALPNGIDDLVNAGLIREAPDAQGGKFVMDEDGQWSYEPPAEQKDERFVEATPQQLDRFNTSVKPDFDAWAYAWVKANFDETARLVMRGNVQRNDGRAVFVVRHPGRAKPIEIRIYAGDGTPATPPYQAWLKQRKPLLEEQVALWRAAGMDISMDDIEINLQADPEDQFDEEMEAAYEATNDSIIQTLNSQTALFKFKNNRLPKGAEELVEASFLQNVPEPPKPGKYVMDENGQWSFEPANDQPAEKAPATQPATQPAEDISDAQAEKTAESLGKIVKLFKTQKGRLPKSLHELVEKDYIPAIPQAPKGKAYKLDSKLGLVAVVDAKDAAPARKKFKPLSRPERSAAKSDLQTMRTQMQLFKFKEDRWPKSLQELVEKYYMQEIPEAPGNREWIYDAATGEVSLEGEDL